MRAALAAAATFFTEYRVLGSGQTATRRVGWILTRRCLRGRKYSHINQHFDDEPDEPPAELEVLNATEGVSQGHAVATGEEFGYIIWCERRSLPFDACARFGESSKKNAGLTRKMREICCNRLAPIRISPVSYFCTVCQLRPSLRLSSVWFIFTIRRRVRTRFPTY
jgi:hypothetical protein